MSDRYVLLNPGDKPIKGDEVYDKDSWKPVTTFYHLHVPLPADVMTLAPVRRPAIDREPQRYSIMGVVAADGSPAYQYTTDNPDGKWMRSDDVIAALSDTPAEQDNTGENT